VTLSTFNSSTSSMISVCLLLLGTCHPKKVGNFWSSGRADLSIYKVCPGEKKMEKLKLLGRPTCQRSPHSHIACPLAPAATCHLLSPLYHCPTHVTPSSAGRCRDHATLLPPPQHLQNRATCHHDSPVSAGSIAPLTNSILPKLHVTCALLRG
jgi:hypothetical protein